MSTRRIRFRQFIPLRSDMPRNIPLRLAIQPSGLVLVEVNRKLSLADMAEEFNAWTPRSIASGVWTPRGEGGFLRAEFTVDGTLGEAVEMEVEGQTLHVQLRAGQTVTEALGSLVPRLTRRARTSWDLRIPAEAGRTAR